MNRNVFILLLFIAPLIARGQKLLEKRIELPLRDGYSSYNTHVFEEEGAIVLALNDEREDDFKVWSFWKYDIDLDTDESAEIKVPKRQFLQKTVRAGKKLHLFFLNRKSKAYTLYTLDVRDLKTNKVVGFLPKKVTTGTMVVSENLAYIQGFKKRDRFLITINMATSEQKVVPLGFDKGIRITFDYVHVDTSTNKVFVFVNAGKKKAVHGLWVEIFDNGQRVERFNLSEGEELLLSSASGTQIGPDHYLFTGTYSSKSTGMSEGLMIKEVRDGKATFSKFYNFSEFENFFKYLSARRQNKIEKKKKRKKKRGKELKLNYLIASHPVMQLGDKYIYLGEAYYPTYRTETYTTYVNGRPVVQTRQVFDGYQYTHAILTAYDEEGNMVWDQIFEMWPGYKPFHVKRFVKTSINGQVIDMVFTSRSAIKSMAFTSVGEIAGERSVDYIKTDSETDKVRYTFSNVDHWYGKSFLAFGSQTIKDKSGERPKGKKKKRRVYFMNKFTMND